MVHGRVSAGRYALADGDAFTLHPMRMRLRGASAITLCAVSIARVQLLLYAFGPDADFEGQFVGALERIESGGTLRVLDVLLVAREADTGELVAIGMRGTGAGGMVAPLVGFRLDLAERRRATRRALAAERASAVPPETLRAMGDALEPGGALAAVLVEHAWVGPVEDAVARMGGEERVAGFVGAASLAELAPDLLAATGGRPAPATGLQTP
jgi:hypothetical protein